VCLVEEEKRCLYRRDDVFHNLVRSPDKPLFVWNPDSPTDLSFPPSLGFEQRPSDTRRVLFLPIIFYIPPGFQADGTFPGHCACYLLTPPPTICFGGPSTVPPGLRVGSNVIPLVLGLGLAKRRNRVVPLGYFWSLCLVARDISTKGHI
jgi:hypothetical protein